LKPFKLLELTSDGVHATSSQPKITLLPLLPRQDLPQFSLGKEKAAKNTGNVPSMP